MGGKGHYLDGMDAGADDFITKPFDPEQLMARLRVAERILGLHEALRVQATHDGLTGLLNRTAVVESLEHELDRSLRDNRSLGIIMLDLDHFKRINDTYGHTVGDTVLREAARRLKSLMRSYDKLGRYGGGEFLIVCPGCNEADILTLAGRILHSIGGETFHIGDTSVTGEKRLAVSCSIGTAISSLLKRMNSGFLIDRADKALYRAKEAGRNRIEGSDEIEGDALK